MDINDIDVYCVLLINFLHMILNDYDYDHDLLFSFVGRVNLHVFFIFNC